MKTWKIAAVQMGCQFADVSANRAAIQTRFREAASQGAQLVIFPECILSGYGFESAEEAWPHTEKLPGPTTDLLAKDCRELNAWCIFGPITLPCRPTKGWSSVLRARLRTK